MLFRLLAAVCGAVIITTGLFLVMETLTSLWRNQDRERVFRIDDVLSKPEPGRPERPAPLERQPELPGTDFVSPADSAAPVSDGPGMPPIALPPPVEPALERPQSNPSGDQASTD